MEYFEAVECFVHGKKSGLFVRGNKGKQCFWGNVAKHLFLLQFKRKFSGRLREQILRHQVFGFKVWANGVHKHVDFHAKIQHRILIILFLNFKNTRSIDIAVNGASARKLLGHIEGAFDHFPV